MKKFLIVLFTVLLVFTFSACEKQPTLIDNLSELRSDCFFGEKDDFTIRAVYGFKEKQKSFDGNIGESVYKLSFKLTGYQDEVSYTLSFNFENTEYSGEFKFDPIRNSLMLDIEIADFNLKEFEVNLKKESTVIPITLKSLLPENTIDYKTALNFLLENQPDLMNAYKTEEGYALEIQMRITVKNDKPYWFIGLTSKSGDHKVLLIDGLTGNVLAVRDVF